MTSIIDVTSDARIDDLPKVPGVILLDTKKAFKGSTTR